MRVWVRPLVSLTNPCVNQGWLARRSPHSGWWGWEGTQLIISWAYIYQLLCLYVSFLSLSFSTSLSSVPLSFFLPPLSLCLPLLHLSLLLASCSLSLTHAFFLSAAGLRVLHPFPGEPGVPAQRGQEAHRPEICLAGEGQNLGGWVGLGAKRPAYPLLHRHTHTCKWELAMGC